jgi:Secretion system C-terminal sorting domain
MKTIIFSWVALLCLLISVTPSNAQDSINITTTQNLNYTQQFDSSHDASLDITQVPFGVLYNRVFGWSAISNQKDIATVTKNKLVQAWYDLYTASYTFGNSLTFADFTDHLVQYDLNKKVPIIAMQYNFAALDSSGILPISTDSFGNYIDANGVILPKIPNTFIRHQAHLAGLYIDEVTQNQSIVFVLDEKLFLQNTDNTINKVSIFNGTTLLATLLPNAEAEVIFTASGKTELKIVCELTNGDVITSLQTITVAPYKKIRGICGDAKHFPISSTIPFQGYNETVATTTNADYHVFFKFLNNDPSNCDDKITKPLIFLDGFDDLNQRQFRKIYNEYLTTDRINTPGNIAEKLRLAGYDLIILNFPRLGEIIDLGGGNNLPISNIVKTSSNTNVVRNNRDGGTDFIERNAMVFIELVKKINNEVATNALATSTTPEKLVVIGPSMGGQVSRYGLAFMEKKYAATNIATWKHNCRLYVSFDSPHEGANIAIGVQQALDHLGNFYGNWFAFNAYTTKIRSVAARQLLIDQLDGLNGSASFHQKYYNGTTNNGFDALNTNGLPGSHGYPMNCRKIALVNGSGDGIETLFAGAEVGFVRATAAFNTDAFGLHLRFTENTGISNKTFEGYNLEKLGKLAGWNTNLYTSVTNSGFLTNNLHLKRFHSVANWNYWAALPPGVPNTVANVLLWTTFLSWHPSHFVHDKIIKRRSTFTTTNANSHGCLDAAPGGMIDAVGQILDNVQIVLNDNLSSGTICKIDNFVNHPFSCFIPTISGLGFKNSNFKWNTKVSDRNLICSNGNETYFDNYYAPAMNQGHVQITNDSYAWMEKELANGHQGTDCISLCGITKLNGEDFICLNQTEIYTLDNLIGLGATTGIVTKWYSSPGLALTPFASNPNNKINVKALPNAGHYEWIAAEISNPCGAEVVTIYKNIHSGAVSYSLSFKKKFPGSCDWEAVVTCTNPFATANYSWSNDFINFTPGSDKYGTYKNIISFGTPVYVKILNKCVKMVELSDKFLVNVPNEPGCLYKTAPVYTTGEFKGKEVSVFPNPTNDYWNIEIPNYQNKMIDVKLFDLTGQELLHKEYNYLQNGLIQIDGQHLKPNVYLLKVILDNKSYSLKIVKQ